MLLDCTLDSLQLFRDFVSRGFEETLINLTAIGIFEYLLLQLNKLNNFSYNVDYMELCPAAFHMGHKSLELHLQLLNTSLGYFRVCPELHRNYCFLNSIATK